MSDEDLHESESKNLDLLFDSSRKLGRSSLKLSISQLKADSVSKGENLKRILRRYETERSDRAARISGNHRFILDLSAMVIGVTVETLIEGISDRDEYVSTLESLFQPGGRCVGITHYQKMHPPDISSGRYDHMAKKDELVYSGAFSSGGTIELSELGIVCYRLQSSKHIDARNISDEFYINPLICHYPEISVCETVAILLDRNFSPALNNYTEWGELNKTEEGKRVVAGFKSDFNRFVNFINATKKNVDARVQFNYNHDLFKKYLKSPAAAQVALNNPTVYREVHATVREWIRQMNLVVVQSKQLRREDDSFGPDKELEYWKHHLSKLESVIEQIKRKSSQMYLFYVASSRCDLFKIWTASDKQITKYANEARDNVRYLSTLTKFFDPLYKCAPTEMGQTLPSIINTMRMIYTNSRFFNTPERISPLFIKMTNQMINVCRNYLTENNTVSIWRQYKTNVLAKIEVCLNLYTRYYNSYLMIRDRSIEAQDVPVFEFSENYIFGKFETFKIRIEQIADILSRTLEYSILNSSTFESINQFAERSYNMFKVISNVKKDPLDHRKSSFESDYITFKTDGRNLDEDLYNFLSNELTKVDNIDGSIRILARFVKLGLECFELHERYLDLAHMFANEILQIRDSYNYLRQFPVLGRCLTPVGGRIMWIRQMYSRLTKYMEFFKESPEVLRCDRFQRVIMLYNAFCTVLIHYEDIYHDGWFDFVDQVEIFLAQPVFIRNALTNRLTVNFHPYITETIRECEYMLRLELPVPEMGLTIMFYKEKIYYHLELMKYLVQKDMNIRLGLPKIFSQLGRFALYEIQEAMKPGFSTITWTSSLLTEFCEEVDSLLDNVQRFIKRLIDIRTARIEPALQTIAYFDLLELPEDPVDSREFLDTTIKHCKMHGAELEGKSRLAESSVIDLVNNFMSKIELPDMTKEQKRAWMNVERALRPAGSLPRLNVPDDYVLREIHAEVLFDPRMALSDGMDLFLYFSGEMAKAVVQSVRRALEEFRKRAANRDELGDKPMVPLFETFLELVIPNFIVKPSLEEMNDHFEKAVQSVLSTCKMIAVWGQRQDAQPKEHAKSIRFEYDDLDYEYGPNELHSYYRAVVEHKYVDTARKSLFGAVLRYKKTVDEFCDSFLKYKFLWNPKRDEIIKQFVDTEPIIVEIKEKFLEYGQHTTEVNGIPDSFTIGNMCILTERAKLAMAIESQAWQIRLGKLLSARYQLELNDIVDFINAMNKCLNKKIENLDDIRVGMTCLVKIRESFIDTDFALNLIEEAYNIFAQFNVDIPREDIERVDGLRYSYEKMLERSIDLQIEICSVQGGFADDLRRRINQLQMNINEFEVEFDEKGPMVAGIPAREASRRVSEFQQRLDELWETMEQLATGEKLFGMAPKEYPYLFNAKKQFNMLNRLYGLYNQVMDTIEAYKSIPWSAVDMEAVSAEVADFELRCRKMPKGMKDWPAFIDLSKKINDFNESVPLLQLMASKAMLDRHWARLTEITSYPFDPTSPDFTLGYILQAPLVEHKIDVEDVCVGAVKEMDIETKLKQIMNQWSVVTIGLARFKTRGELLLRVGDIVDIMTALDDSLMIMNSLVTNRYNAPFKSLITLWGSKLQDTSTVLEKWIAVQNLWVYLEAVFVGGDIAKQMPGEAKRFGQIDKQWVRIMARARETPNLMDCCVGDDTLIQILPFLLSQLEVCQKGLTGYLETKRLIFPRFFFISDPVLLEILGQSSNPASITPHLLSLFDAVAEVKFDEKRKELLTTIMSVWKEEVPLERNVQCIGGVEIWLGHLLKSMKDSVLGLIAQTCIFLETPTFDLIYAYPTMIGQIALLMIQLYWTKKTEEALRRSATDKVVMRYVNNYFLVFLNDLIEDTTKDLNKMERTQLETMITIHLHQKDIFDDLVKYRIKSPQDFEWQKQARFYYDPDAEDCIIRITDVIFIYQCEYLGITERLCITPLTDRCYITLAQGIWMNQGGAPAGPAGTGKTETVKDMGRALGKYVVVFNCSDQMDFRGLGRIFKGLAQSGTWGCFDEFNRIDLPVLSVAAQQIYIVLSARKARAPNFIFSDGDDVSLNIEFGIFLTMNPGYAGRQELPENLKIMFRTVAMMVPDRQIIIRVKMASCGFKNNTLLARKFFTLYALCEGQLSKQVHYDFGLRNILSVLRTLGAQKRSNPQETEETIVMRVLRDMNVSKMTNEDSPLLLSLIDDMFPGIKLVSAVNRQLQKAIANQTEKMGLINSADFNLKVVQLYDTSLVRHGLMSLGPTGAGKTCSMHCLQNCFTEMGRPHAEMRMNPKAITAPQMFGRLDVSTNDWTDGIFSTLWRRTLKVKLSHNTWLVLDGPVDAVWIENLNSVLDDNKTLTLANGDRIVMAPNCKLVFEPDNVDNASPATVSRMGMVFISSSVLDWSTLADGWLLKRSAQENRVFRSLFDRIYDDLITFVVSRLFAKMAVLEAVYIRQTCDVLSGLIDYDPTRKFIDRHLERFFLFALMWSLGALLELDDRYKMQEYALAHKSKLNWPKLETETETIFEYLVDEHGKWVHWNERVVNYVYPSDSVPDYNSLLIPNVDNVRTNYLIDITTQNKKPLLLIGEQGTAKTVMIKGYMMGYNQDYQLSKSLNFSSATTPEMFQRIIESYVEKRVATSYGPPGGRKMTVFIDDINMPVINDWGDQITNEIVRQLMEYGGFYSLEKPGDFIFILDVLLVAAMIHPGGGRNDIPPRLKRQFCIYNCTLPSETSMDKIFDVIGNGYFCKERFPEHIVSFIPKLIPLTRRLWQLTKIKMLPTPAKFHYVFNLRDLSRIWQGILTIQAPECPEEYLLMQLWCHECTRVIADRFTCPEDREWFAKCMKRTCQEILGSDFMYYPSEFIYFVDFYREAPEPTGDEPDDFDFSPPKIYEDWKSREFCLTKIHQFQELYNEQTMGASMDLVFFNDALMHLLIISRIVRTSRGNALLVGVGGSGKQSLTKLASFIAGYVIYQITLTRSYNLNNLTEDLKYLYKVTGVRGDGLSFIFTDNEIKEESFLEYINNVLSSGEIANLFPKDELDELYAELIPVLKKVDPRRDPNPDNLYGFFIERARTNLHIVLCFSPVGEKFRNRSLKFPGLISGCTIDWFSKWPIDALEAVASHLLGDYYMVAVPQVKQLLIVTTAFVHDFVQQVCTSYFERFRRQVYVTPKSFLTFLASYKIMYKSMHEGIKVLADNMNTGLVKLDEAGRSVDVLRKELVVKEKEIAEANKKAEAILEIVMAATAIATKIKEQATITKEQAERLVSVISVSKREAEAKLEDAKPALQAAEAALQTLTGSDIATVRKLGKPPYLITLIMDCVCILFKRRLERVIPDPEKKFFNPSWQESLRVMADTNFLKNLQNYPKDTINEEIVDLMTPYLQYPLYTFENAKVACGNVAGLISWTIAMVSFYAVNKDVLPLKANLAKQQAKLDRAMAKLNAAMALLKAKEEEVAACQREYDGAMELKRRVLEDARQCQEKMDAATALIVGLSGEKTRWIEALKGFKDQINRLIGDVLILVGFLGYTGPFNQEFRNHLIDSWTKELNRVRIPNTTGLNLIDTLTDQATIGEWGLQGLPSDELSIQNGIIVTKAARYPLLIDPQTQGKIWIAHKEKHNNIVIVTLTDKWLRQHIEDCVSLGYPLLIVDVFEEIDPVLDSVLEKNYIKVGNTIKVKVGDREVDVSEDFRLYITTKLANPKYSPEVSARTSIIDFTVTLKGLEDQLLGRVIISEKKELEEERVNLITNVTANKRKMKELEDNLLHKLTTTQGSLVEDVTVIQVLNVTKETAARVGEELIIAKDTEIKINAAREEFRPVATRGSVLYFLIVSMAEVNVMYQTSLVQFLERFDISLVRSTKAFKTEKRLRNIMEYLTFEVFRYKSRGLYEAHKYMFVLMLSLRIDLERKFITAQEFDYLIKGGAALDLNACPPKPAKWITDATWLNLVALSQLPQYHYILAEVGADDRGWRTWFEKDAPEENVMPGHYSNLDVFRQLLIVRAWCPDRILAASRKYISFSQGPRFAEPVIINYQDMFAESRPMTPLICFLSMGSDPTTSIESLAKNRNKFCGCMSMGQGQEVHARKLMTQCLENGGWVLLQNCHLGLEYMEEILVQLLELEKLEQYHKHFRLWLTSEPHDRFPIALLQICIKFTNEPPQGIKAGLKRTYTGMSQDMLDYSTSPYYLPFIYGISYLHTIVQERRKFGPLGWNIPYEFNFADWLCCCLFVQNHLDDLDPERGISWPTVRYMFGEVHYGGRVTDDFDKRLLNTFCRNWFGEFMFAETFNYYPGYVIYRYKVIADYLRAIDSMLSVDPPQAYGLHPNADIIYQSVTATNMLNQILSIQPKEGGGGGGETREQVVGRISVEMLSKTPPAYDPFAVRDRMKLMGATAPMNIFLKQEIDRIQRVIKIVKSTLSDILLGIEGTIIMNESLQQSFDFIYDARIPPAWARYSWESSTLGFWFTELLERNAQFYSWAFVGRPWSFWMTGFFNPQGFLTSMRQEVARAHKGWALDTVVLHNEVTKYPTKDDVKAPVVEGVLVYGLFLDGAGWDKRINKMVESINKILYTQLPVIHIFAINSMAPKDPKLYVVPVYKKPKRTGLTYINTLWLPSNTHPDHWVLRGVALLCDIK